MLRLVFITLFAFLSFSNVYASASKVAIIVPMEHEAMSQIVAGINESLSLPNISTQNLPNISVQNAQGDSNIQLALIKQMKDYDILMPIGSSACQMTLAHRPDKYTVCVAAKMDKNTAFMTGVNDEIPITISLAKLPKLKHITVIYSATEKIAPEIEELQKYGTEHSVELSLRMIQNLSDITSAVKTSPANTEAFLVLKDHLVVSAINIITKEAMHRKIPVITSDEGSVKNGATFAIGVKEKDTGIEAGKIAKLIINGTNPKDIVYQNMSTLTTFVNMTNFAKQNQISLDNLADIGLPIVKL